MSTWLARRLINLLIRGQKQDVFMVPTNSGEPALGREIHVVLRLEHSHGDGGMKVDNALLMPSGSNYLLARAASNKYKMSVEKIRELCKQKKIICTKDVTTGWWVIDEDSLRAYCFTA